MVNQQTVHILANLKFHHVCNSLPHVPVLSQISPVRVCHPVSWRSMLMLSPLICLGLPDGFFRSGFLNKSYAYFISPCMLHTPHISLFDSSNYFVKSRDFEHAHNVVFFIPLLPFPFSPRYHSQHLNLKHPQPMFLSPCETGFTPI